MPRPFILLAALSAFIVLPACGGGPGAGAPVGADAETGDVGDVGDSADVGLDVAEEVDGGEVGGDVIEDVEVVDDIGLDGDAEDSGDVAADIVDEEVDEDRPGLDARPVNATCHAPPRPPEGSGVRLTRVYAPLTFPATVAMVQPPGDNSRWYVVQLTGQLLVFDNVESPGPARVVADLSDRVGLDHNEKGLLGMAFSPDYATSREFYVYYTLPGVTDFEARLSRFVMSADGEGLETGEEVIVLSVIQPYGNHNGGHLAFGPDGYLYLGLGDGGGAFDYAGRGQDTSTVLGSMLRLDVVGQATYAIPPDNPFAQGGGAPEIYAWGLRNPWRFDVDRATGEIWLGDVGWMTWEEINRIERGGNYGWSVREGAHCVDAAGCDPTGLIDPIVEYTAVDVRTSVTGGIVYRGSAIPWLYGRFVYGDFYSGPIEALAWRAAEQRWEAEVLIEQYPVNIATFAQDQQGELYIPSLDGRPNQGVIFKLEPVEAPEPDQVPRRLSETGCVDEADPRRPAAGLIPYALNAPFWSDGAEKERYMALPGDAALVVDAAGRLEAPPGSVLIKHFELAGRRIETRLLVHHDDGVWAGYSYMWDADGADATLLPGSRRERYGATRWHFPSREECLSCHTSVAGFGLGLELAQLDREVLYPSTGRRADQIGTLRAIGVLPEALPAFEPLADPAGGGTLEARARALLHADCAMCHQPGAPIPVSLDLRATTPAAEAGFCDAAPQAGALGIAEARVVAPGEPERSVLLARMRALDVGRMPPLASLAVDVEGTALIEAWIAAGAGCP